MKKGSTRAVARPLLQRIARFGRSSSSAVFYLALLGSLSVVALAANLAGAALRTTPQALQRVTPATHAHPAAVSRSLSPGGTSRSFSRPAVVSGRGAATGAAPRLAVSVAQVPKSGGVSEPSIALDSTGAIYVTGPTGLDHDRTTSSASPLWKSSDGGASWSGPVSTETGGQTATGIGGGDSDIVIDRNDDIFVTSLWLGNTTMGVSTDHGATFTTLPIGHTTPIDDRPWLAYDPGSGALYMTWDGAGALHVGKTVLGSKVQNESVPNPVGAQGQLVFAQDVPAVPNEPTRGCGTCPPGTIAVDPSGNVSVAFSGPGGVGVATSTDGGITWNGGISGSNPPAYVPKSSTTDNPQWGSANNNFQILRSDSQGNLYLVWTQIIDTNTQMHAVMLSYKQAGSANWHTPIQVSPDGANAIFGTVAPVSPGNVDVAYYGIRAGADSTHVKFDLYLAKVQGLFGAPSTVTADVLPGFHTAPTTCNPTDSSCLVNGPDRRLGDFFSIAVDSAGLANIITVADCSGGSHCLQFVHEDPAPAPSPSPIALTVPPPAQAQGGYPYPNFPQIAQPNLQSNNMATSTPTPDAGNSAAADGGSAGTQQGGDRSGGSSPKYPDGVAVSGPPDQTSRGSGGGAPLGLPLWVYGLAGGGASVGRFLLRRGR